MGKDLILSETCFKYTGYFVHRQMLADSGIARNFGNGYRNGDTADCGFVCSYCVRRIYI